MALDEERHGARLRERIRKRGCRLTPDGSISLTASRLDSSWQPSGAWTNPKLEGRKGVQELEYYYDRHSGPTQGRVRRAIRPEGTAWFACA